MAIHLRHFTALCKYFSAMTLLLNEISSTLCLFPKVLKQAPHLSGKLGQSRDTKRIAFSLLYNIMWCCGESTCFPPPRGLGANSSNGTIICRLSLPVLLWTHPFSHFPSQNELFSSYWKCNTAQWQYPSTCKLRDNTTYSKGLITWPGDAHQQCITRCPVSRFIRCAVRQAWLLGKFPPGISASQYWDPSWSG